MSPPPPSTPSLRPRPPLRFPLALKFLLAVGGLLVALSAGASLLFFVEARKAAHASLERQGDAIASTLGYSIEILLDNDDLLSIQRVVSNSALLPDVRQVLIVDRAGKVIASSDRLEMGSVTESTHVRAFLARGDVAPAMIAGEGGDLLILRPLRRGRYQSTQDTGVIGVIQITVDRRNIEADAEIGTLRTLAIHLGSYALLSALVALALRAIVVRPLFRLADAAGLVRSGVRSVRSGIRSRDEIGLVSEAFDRMAEEVERTVGTLEDKVKERTLALEKEIDEKSAAYEELRRTQEETDRIKGDLISVVSHELRTPLTAIRGAIGLLVGGVLGPLPEGPMEMLTIAERNTQRLIALVNDILDLDRLQQGILELHPGRVAAAQIIERSIEAVAAFAAEERVHIDVTSAEGHVRGDDHRLVQVLVNLLSNAIKFSPPESHVTVSASAGETDVEIRVADHGPGIPAAHRGRIFERFHQVQEPSTRRQGGTGLGLSISKGLVEQHGGTIGVESAEGEGSTFWFRIPRDRSLDTL